MVCLILCRSLRIKLIPGLPYLREILIRSVGDEIIESELGLVLHSLRNGRGSHGANPVERILRLGLTSGCSHKRRSKAAGRLRVVVCPQVFSGRVLESTHRNIILEHVAHILILLLAQYAALILHLQGLLCRLVDGIPELVIHKIVVSLLFFYLIPCSVLHFCNSLVFRLTYTHCRLVVLLFRLVVLPWHKARIVGIH